MIDMCANNTNVLVFMYSYVVAVLYHPTCMSSVCIFALHNWLSYARHPSFKNSSLNLGFPVRKYKTFNTILQGMVMNKLDFVVAC